VYPDDAHGTDLLARTSGVDLQSVMLALALRYAKTR
jgi:hypothetical protein